MGCYWFHDTNTVFLGRLYNLWLGAQLWPSLRCPQLLQLFGPHSACLVFSVSLLIWRQSSRFVGDLGEQLAFVGAIPLLPATVDRPWAWWCLVYVDLWILDL